MRGGVDLKGRVEAAVPAILERVFCARCFLVDWNILTESGQSSVFYNDRRTYLVTHHGEILTQNISALREGDGVANRHALTERSTVIHRCRFVRLVSCCAFTS